MEAPEYLPPTAAYFRGGAAQFACDKQQQQQQQTKAAVGAGDHFIVEDLFDFSNDGEEGDYGGLGAGGGPDANADSSTVTASDTSPNSSSGSDNCCNGGSGGGGGSSSELHCDPESANFADVDLSGELCVPYDELADLEWLSNLVDEDDFSNDDLQKLHLITGSGSLKSSAGEFQPQFSSSIAVTSESAAIASEKPVGKSRSKRSRGPPSNWTSRLLVLNPTIDTCSAESELIVPHPAADPPMAPAKKAPKVVKKKEGQDGLAPAPDGRKCLHCATDKTPQWRTGPMGPKTLCNACGVRYKSGRLVPEYRPAASPTFVLSKHSNSHRKVMELRRQKELVVQQQQGQHQQQQHGGAQFLHNSNHRHQGSAFFEGPVAGGDDFQIHHHHQHVGPDFRQLI